MERQGVTRTGIKVNMENQCLPRPSASFRFPDGPLHQLQQALGNRGFGEFIQTKLKVSQPGDQYELEADRIADRVMRMPDEGNVESVATGEQSQIPDVQRKCGKCEEEDEREVQRKATDDSAELRLNTRGKTGASGEVTPVAAAHIDSLGGNGQPLSPTVRAFFEPRFGYDFSNVRVHTDAKAAQSARAVNALAYTLGQDLVFGAGQYAPESTEGRRLLAHELTHAVQQHGNQETVIRRYTPAELATCECLTWSIPRMLAVANAMVAGGNLSGRTYAASFMRHFLSGGSDPEYVDFDVFRADSGGQAAFDAVNASLSNEFLADADALPCAGSQTGVAKSASVQGHFTYGTDLFYAMGGFSLSAAGTGTVRKNCGTGSACTGIEAQIDILYRVNDLYDWKKDPGGCTPATGETGCTANTKTVTLPVFGVICDECLNRLVIHDWATEFMVMVRGVARGYSISGPCGFRNPTTPPSTRDNAHRDD